MHEEEIKIEFDELFTQLGEIYGLCSLYNNILLLGLVDQHWVMMHYINPEDEKTIFAVKDIAFETLDDAKIGTYKYMLQSSFFGEKTLKILNIAYPASRASYGQKYRLKMIFPEKYSIKGSMDLLTKQEAKQIIENHALDLFITKLISIGKYPFCSGLQKQKKQP